MYFSLQYLSYSDAVVLRHTTPILTGFSGAIFLKERLLLKQFVAGCKYFVVELASTGILRDASVQPFWSGSDCQASVPFWWPAGESIGLCYSTTKDDICHVRTSPFLSQIFFLILLRSAALVGVVGASGTRELGFRQLRPHLYPYRSNSHSPPRHWKASTSTPRQRFLLLAMRAVLNNRVCSPPQLISFLKVPLVAHPSMMIFQIPPVM